MKKTMTYHSKGVEDLWLYKEFNNERLLYISNSKRWVVKAYQANKSRHNATLKRVIPSNEEQAYIDTLDANKAWNNTFGWWNKYRTMPPERSRLVRVWKGEQ